MVPRTAAPAPYLPCPKEPALALLIGCCLVRTNEYRRPQGPLRRVTYLCLPELPQEGLVVCGELGTITSQGTAVADFSRARICAIVATQGGAVL